MNLNTGTNTVPVWTNVPPATGAGSGTGLELRWNNQSNQGTTASASWPYMTRPGATGQVDYLYVFTADTTSLGSLGTSTNVPVAFLYTNYMHSRWNWDNTGTFASAPIFTAYPSTAHGSITAGDGSILGGNATDTSSTSYFKANVWGRVTSAGAPAAAPTNAPAVTNGTAGASSPTAGANWLTNFQSLQGGTQYTQFPATPAATTADQWNTMFTLYTGPNMTTGTWTPVLTFSYTFV